MAFNKRCGPCGGSGYYGTNPKDTCAICQGVGSFIVPGQPEDYHQCKPCGASGYYHTTPRDTCKLCNGIGLTKKWYPTVTVAGADRVDPAADHLLQNGVLDGGPGGLLALPNRASLFDQLDALLKNTEPVGVLFIDLDGFKAVNDTLGHAAGDKCLEGVAVILGSVVSGRGKLYRYGGDEFVLVMPNTAREEITATGERVRREIEESNLGGALVVTASIGAISSRDADCLLGAAELVEAADKGVYISKKNGKNTVTPVGIRSEDKT